MQTFLLNQLLKRIGNKLGKSMFNDTLNPDEAYADRISKDFGISWHDAYDAYHQNPNFWEKSYKENPNDRRNSPPIVSVKRTSRLPDAPSPAEDGAPSKRRAGFGRSCFLAELP